MPYCYQVCVQYMTKINHYKTLAKLFLNSCIMLFIFNKNRNYKYLFLYAVGIPILCNRDSQPFT